jgi:hypothetical protein
LVALRNAAVQGVVFEALEMRLVSVNFRLCGERHHRERGVPPPPVSPAIGHVMIERHVVPAPVCERGVEQRCAGRRRHKTKTIRADACGRCVDIRTHAT